MMKKPALLRHVLIIGTSVLTGYLLLASRAEWSEMHRYNRALGDLSLLLIVAAMAIGPLARLSSTVHTIIILIGWVELDFARLFGFEFHPQLQRYVMLQHGFALANVVGIAALLYGFVLAGTSNNFSQRVLGTSVWKYIQQGAYVLWWLAVLHTAYFLFFHFLDFHRQMPEPNWARRPFVALVASVIALQGAAVVVTWRSQTSRRIYGAPSQRE